MLLTPGTVTPALTHTSLSLFHDTLKDLTATRTAVPQFRNSGYTCSVPGSTVRVWHLFRQGGSGAPFVTDIVFSMVAV